MEDLEVVTRRVIRRVTRRVTRRVMETLDRKATRGRGRAVRGAGNTTR